MTDTLKCPQCKSDKIIPIVYGEPDADMLEAEKWGELEISQDLYIPGVSPNRKCLSCGCIWYESVSK